MTLVFGVLQIICGPRLGCFTMQFFFLPLKKCFFVVLEGLMPAEAFFSRLTPQALVKNL